MRPGDLIEWHYRKTGKLVDAYDTVWSTVLQRYVPIGSKMVHLLISVDDSTLVWLNDMGLFQAKRSDRTESIIDVGPRAFDVHTVQEPPWPC